jgi:hypothetical protein
MLRVKLIRFLRPWLCRLNVHDYEVREVHADELRLFGTHAATLACFYCDHKRRSSIQGRVPVLVGDER